MNQVKLGVIRETKIPPDRRVPLTPKQCRELSDRYASLEILVQPSDYRCYTNEEYIEEGVRLSEDLSGCDILMGVKEVKIEALLKNKTYLFFSHTAKKQPYNRELLRSIVDRRIRLLDYEYLTGTDELRVVAFGRWAGVVGAYNGLRAFGSRNGNFDLTPANVCHDLVALKSELKKVELGKTRIVLTGGGRVAGGAMEVIKAAGIKEVSPKAYLEKECSYAIFTRLDPWHYTRRADGSAFEFQHFISQPGNYVNNFGPYARRSDIFIACHFWDPDSPKLLTRQELSDGTVPISIIADISCDIDGPIPPTIRASTIAAPFYGYDPVTGLETKAFRGGSITVMAVDNLPGELPRDASADFGLALMERVLPELLGLKDTGMLDRACITRDGKLTDRYAYLKDYLEGSE